MGVHDDAVGIGTTMAVPPGTTPFVHLIAGTPTLVMVLNAIVAGAIAAIASFRFAHSDAPATIVIAIAVAATVLGAEFASARSKIAQEPACPRADVSYAADDADRRSARLVGGMPAHPRRDLLGQSRDGDACAEARDGALPTERRPAGHPAGRFVLRRWRRRPDSNR